MDRTGSLGASDAAAALGVSPWKSPYQLWAEKTGIAAEPDLSENEAVEWGSILEPIIAETYARKTGRKVEHNRNALVTRHPDLPFLTATLDATQRVTDRTEPWFKENVGALEIKTTGYYAEYPEGSNWDNGPPMHFRIRSSWDEEPPIYYQIQLQHQLAVTGLTWGTLCVLIGGQKFRWFDQKRNERFIEMLLTREAEFWAMIVDRIPPDPDGSIATTETIKRLYPEDHGGIIALPAQAYEIDEELMVTKRVLKDLEDKRRQLENTIKTWLKGATTGVLPCGARYTWKQQTAHHEAKEAYTSTYRVLRRSR